MNINFEPVAKRLREPAEAAIKKDEGPGLALDETWVELDRLLRLFVETSSYPTSGAGKIFEIKR